MLNSLIYIFFASTSIWTLFNPSGTRPFSLLVAILILFILTLRGLGISNLRFRITAEDVFILMFLLASTISVLLNVSRYSLNFNHLYAELSVTALYYFNIKAALVNSAYRQAPAKILNAVYTAAVIIAITGIVDYAFLTQGVNIAEILPMEQANVVAGTGMDSRARGFFVEPTDFAMALNAFFPMLLLYTFYTRSMGWVAWLSSIYVFGLIISRSAAGIGGLLIGILMALIMAVFSRDIKFLRTIKIGLLFFCCLFLVMGVAEMFFEGFWSSIIAKILFSEESSSAVARTEAYSRIFSLLSSAGVRILYGYGTGFLSGEFGSGSHSWFLSVLTENGIVGLGILFTLILYVFLRLYRMKSKLKYGLLISFVAVNIQYLTQTGFYFPFFWILLVFAQLDWSKYSLKKPLIITKPTDASSKIHFLRIM